MLLLSKRSRNFVIDGYNRHESVLKALESLITVICLNFKTNKLSIQNF